MNKNSQPRARHVPASVNQDIYAVLLNHLRCIGIGDASYISPSVKVSLKALRVFILTQNVRVCEQLYAGVIKISEQGLKVKPAGVTSKIR
jgi:hypothetical protein